MVCYQLSDYEQFCFELTSFLKTSRVKKFVVREVGQVVNAFFQVFVAT